MCHSVQVFLLFLELLYSCRHGHCVMRQWWLEHFASTLPVVAAWQTVHSGRESPPCSVSFQPPTCNLAPILS